MTCRKKTKAFPNETRSCFGTKMKTYFLKYLFIIFEIPSQFQKKKKRKIEETENSIKYKTENQKPNVLYFFSFQNLNLFLKKLVKRR